MTRPYAPSRLLSALVVTVLALLGLTLPASASLAVPSDAGPTVTDRNHVSLSHLGVGPGAGTKAGQGAGGGSGDGPAPDGGSASGPTVASASDPGVEAPADSGPAESTEPTEPAAGPAESTTGPAESAGSTESDPAAVSEPATDPFTGDTPLPPRQGGAPEGPGHRS